MPEDRREPLLARVSLLFLLINIFLWVGFRNVDVLIVSLSSTLIAFIGAIAGYRAQRRIRRYGGRIQGEGMATVGYYANLVLFLLALLLFCYSFAMAVLRGEIL